MYCSNCGAKNEDAAKVCVNCGNVLQEDAVETENTIPQEVNVEETVAQETEVTNEELMAEVDKDIEMPAPSKKSFPVKWIVTGAIAIVAAIVIFFGAKWIMGMFAGSDDAYSYLNKPVTFVQNGNVMMYKANFKEPVKLGKMEKVSNITCSEDGSRIFFIYDKKLYYRDVNEKEPKGDKADSIGVKISGGDVNSFVITKKGDMIAYRKDTKLLISNLKGDPISVANDVTDYSLSENGKTIYYEKTADGETTAYTRGVGKNDEAVKIGTKISVAAKLGDGYEKIYFVDENNNLYLKEGKKDKVKVTSDVENNCIKHLEVDDKDYLYLVKANKVEYTYQDLIEDDCADDPKDLEYPDYPNQYDDKYELEDGEYDEEAYEKDKEAYEKELDKYYEIQNRNNIREYLKDFKQEANSYTIFKLDGTKIKEVTKDVSDVDNEGAFIFLTKASATSVSKIKLSTLESTSDFYDAVNKMFSGEGAGEKSILKTDGTIIPYTLEDELCAITDDVKYAFAYEGKVEDSSKGRTLVRYEITKSGFKSRKEIANDVISCYIHDYDRNDLLVEVKTGEKTVGLGIFDGKNYKKVSDDIKGFYDVEYVKGTLYYVEDPSSKGVGTLKKWKNGKDTKISDDVYDFIVRKDDKVFYLKDFSETSYKGDLYQSGKKDAIAEGVSSLGYYGY